MSSQKNESRTHADFIKSSHLKLRQLTKKHNFEQAWEIYTKDNENLKNYASSMAELSKIWDKSKKEYENRISWIESVLVGYFGEEANPGSSPRTKMFNKLVRTEMFRKTKKAEIGIDVVEADILRLFKTVCRNVTEIESSKPEMSHRNRK